MRSPYSDPQSPRLHYRYSVIGVRLEKPLWQKVVLGPLFILAALYRLVGMGSSRGDGSVVPVWPNDRRELPTAVGGRLP